jgi:hypothetical protein
MNMETGSESRGQDYMRRRVEQHNWRQHVTAMVILAALAASTGFASGCHSSAANKSNAQANASSQTATPKSASDGAEIVLPVA